MKLFCVILSWRIHAITHLSKCIKCARPRPNPNGDYGLGVIIMCQCRSSTSNECPPLVEMVTVEEGVHVWGRGYMYSLLSTQFFWEPETTLKTSIKIKGQHILSANMRLSILVKHYRQTCKSIQHFRTGTWQHPTKLLMHLSFDSAISLRRIYSMKCIYAHSYSLQHYLLQNIRDDLNTRA